MIRYYITRIIVVDYAGDNTIYHARVPKYFKSEYNTDGLAVKWSMMDYGLVHACLVVADVTQQQHNGLVSNSDLVSPPENIDQEISNQGALSKVKNVLETLNLPADWVQTTTTYRDVLRKVCGLFQFAQRYHGMHREALVDGEFPLDLTWGQINSARQAKILATAIDMGYASQEPPDTWEVRRILKYLADQWGDKPIPIGLGQTL